MVGYLFIAMGHLSHRVKNSNRLFSIKRFQTNKIINRENTNTEYFFKGTINIL